MSLDQTVIQMFFFSITNAQILTIRSKEMPFHGDFKTKPSILNIPAAFKETNKQSEKTQIQSPVQHARPLCCDK